MTTRWRIIIILTFFYKKKLQFRRRCEKRERKKQGRGNRTEGWMREMKRCRNEESINRQMTPATKDPLLPCRRSSRHGVWAESKVTQPTVKSASREWSQLAVKRRAGVNVLQRLAPSVSFLLIFPLVLPCLLKPNVNWWVHFWTTSGLT